MANNDNYEYMRFLDITGVEQIWNTAKQTFVQTVNGVGIDANGNVNVSGGGNLTTDEGNFVKSEYNKTLNLLDMGNICQGGFNVKNGAFYATTERLRNNLLIPLKAGTYTLSFSNLSQVVMYIYDTNGAWLSAYSQINWQNTQSYTFTIPFDFKVGFAWRYANDGTILPSALQDAMLVEGNTAQTYQAYNGAVVHNSEIKGDLLWENANPSNVFNATHNISALTLSSYKYLVVECKAYSAFNAGAFIYKFRINTSYTGNIGSMNYIDDQFIGRPLGIDDATHFYFGDSYAGGTKNNNYMIPVRVYGTNNL